MATNRKTGLNPGQHDALVDLIQRADRNLALVELQLQQAYGGVWGGKMRTLRRQLRGAREDVRLRFLEEEVKQI